jgi:hypothetical protein
LPFFKKNKNKVMFKFLQNKLQFEQKANIFAKFFSENILKITTSVPGRPELHRCFGSSVDEGRVEEEGSVIITGIWS